MKTVEVILKGTAAILINRFKEQSEVVEAVKKSTKKDYGTPRQQAEQTAYFDDKTKNLWIPSAWITGTIQAIASDYKLPGTRKSFKSVSGGCVIPGEEKIYFVEKYKVKDLEIDSRPVVIQRARIMRHRARLESWTLKFTLEIDDSIIPTKDVHQVLSDAGKRSGLGDYRPQKGGPFGRFIVTSWKEFSKEKVKRGPKKKVSG